jgi:RimJ/RimL family protein N-acetyltransferase
LLDRLKVIARSMSCRRIELDTGIENAHAQRVYTAYGFRPLAVHYALAV